MQLFIKMSRSGSLAAAGTLALAGALVFVKPLPVRSQGAGALPPLYEAPNGAGVARTITTDNYLDTNSPFFQPLGTNGRACGTCHKLTDGMSIEPDNISRIFEATQGTDPLFRANDGSVSPNADVSTVDARRSAYAMLISKGLIRVGLPMPDNAEYALAAVDDPYRFASAKELSMFRRPLPTTNLRFLVSVMWDGRQSHDRSVRHDLLSQAESAVTGHAQADKAPAEKVLRDIYKFEDALFTAQSSDSVCGPLDVNGLSGGPDLLEDTGFHHGINDPFSASERKPFNPYVFTMFQAWESISPLDPDPAQQTRLSVARGEKLFNTRPFTITNVKGLNDRLGRPSIAGTCSTCHNTPNVGSFSQPYLMNTGIAAASLRTADLPLYTFRNNATGETVSLTDPGQGLITGKWDDLGKFKVPSLRGIESRSPYMHNSFSGELLDILNFYDKKFSIGFTAQEKTDLKTFLMAL